MIRKIVFPACLSFFFVGCSTTIHTPSSEFKNIIDKKISLKNDLKEVFAAKEKIHAPTSISFSSQKSMSKVLEELAKITGKTYIITKGDDFQIPSFIGSGENVSISTIGDINSYIEPLTGKTIKCVKNCFLKSGISHIEIQDKNYKNSALKDIEISISKNASIKNMLDEIKADPQFQKSGFSVSYAPFLFDSTAAGNQNQQNQSLDKKNYGYLTNVRLMDLFSLLEQRDNVIVGIDYDAKQISIKKRERRTFNLAINNLNISADTNMDNLENASANNGSSQLGTKISLNIVSEVEKAIQKIIEKDDPSLSSYSAIPSTGSFIVFASNNALKAIEAIIEEKNNEFNRSMEFELFFLEVAVKKDFLLGSSIDFQASNAKGGIDSATSFDLASVPSSVLKKTIEKNSLTSSFFLDSKNSIAKTTWSQNIFATQRNFIPYELTRFNTKDYIKRQKVTSTTGTATTTNAEEEIGTSKTGYSIVLLPHIVNNYVSLHIIPSFLKNNGFTTNKEGTTSLPEDERYNYKQNIRMYDGEERIISSESKLEEAKNYEGIFPLEDFIIGGKDGKKYIRIEQLVFLKIKLK